MAEKKTFYHTGTLIAKTDKAIRVDNLDINILDFTLKYVRSIPVNAQVEVQYRHGEYGVKELTRITRLGFGNSQNNNTPQGTANPPQTPAGTPPGFQTGKEIKTAQNLNNTPPAGNQAGTPKVEETTTSASPSPSTGETLGCITKADGITLTIGVTVNLENYENLRMEVSGLQTQKEEMVKILDYNLSTLGRGNPVIAEKIDKYRRQLFGQGGQ